jgi:electron transport complex protein RnfC
MPGIAIPPLSTPLQIDADIPSWQKRLLAAGVNPSRIASPDLIGQLEHAKLLKIDTVICSVLDTDPSVPLNASIAGAFTTEMSAGIAALAKLTAAARVWITADPDKPSDWFAGVQTQLNNAALRLIPLRGDYPQTDPTLMLFTLLQRRLTPGKLPSTKGAMLIDAATAVAVGRCALSDSPALSTPLAVRDHFTARTHLVSAPMNVRLADVLEFLDIHHADSVYRAGDFLRDLWITPDAPMGNGELVVHPTAKHLDANPDPCIHCGWCLEACPMRIHPAGLLDAAQQGKAKLAEKYGINACIECGICSYVCPTRLPLLTAIKGMKTR